jgi:hypothetical protein
MPPKKQSDQETSTRRSHKEETYATRMEQCIAKSPFSNLDRLRNFTLYSPRQDLSNFHVLEEPQAWLLSVPRGSSVDR